MPRKFEPLQAESEVALIALCTALAKYFGGTAAEDHMVFFAELDVDGNGDLSWDEFVAGAKQVEKV